MPRTRFTLRRMMIAIAFLAAFLAIERHLAWSAIRVVSEVGDGKDFIPSEAIMVWVVLQVPVALILLLVYSLLVRPPHWHVPFICIGRQDVESSQFPHQGNGAISQDRLTVRRMMGTVAFVAVTLGVELQLARFAIDMATEPNSDGTTYTQSEAVTVWCALQIPVGIFLHFLDWARKFRHRRPSGHPYSRRDPELA